MDFWRIDMPQTDLFKISKISNGEGDDEPIFVDDDFLTDEPGPEAFINGGKIIKTVEGGKQAVKEMKVVVTEAKLKDAETIDEKFEAIFYWPTKEEWREYADEVGVGQNNRKSNQCNHGISNLCCRVGAHPGQIGNIGAQDIDTQHKIRSDMYLMASIYGPDFSTRTFSEHLLTTRSISESLSDTFNETKEKLPELEVLQGKFSREEIIEQLEKMGGSYTEARINDECTFSARLIADRYGNGSLPEGLDNLGFQTTEAMRRNSEAQRKRNSSRDIADGLVKNAENGNFDEEADAYVYVLEFYNDIYGDFLYVGQVNYDRSVGHRIGKHINGGGNTREYVKIDGEVIYTEEIWFDVEGVWEIKNCYKKEGETVEEFNNRMEAEETEKYDEYIKDKAEKNRVFGTGPKRILGGK